MARSHGVLKTSIWLPGSSFRTLGFQAQWCYVMLLSQPQISNLGVLPFTPERWVRLAADLTAESLDASFAELEESRFIVLDRDTRELLVRTFIRHDKVWSQPKLVTNAQVLIEQVESETIRELLVERHPWLVEVWTKEAIHGHETNTRKPLSEGVSEGVSEKSRGAQGLGQGVGVGVGVGRSSDVKEKTLASTEPTCEGKPVAHATETNFNDPKPFDFAAEVERIRAASESRRKASAA